MENCVRTVYGSALQTCLLLGTPPTLLPNTTLNEKFSIQPNVTFGPNDLPSMRYIAIGNGGHQMVMGANGLSKPDPIQHRSTDAALYNQIPFVLREQSMDLTALERAKYGLRRLETHGGKTYAAYYLKRLDFQNIVPSLEYKTVSNGVTTTTQFTPNTANLNPTPPNLSNVGVNVTTGDYISATAKAPFVLTADEVTDILNAAIIIYGDDGYAIVSEIALCSGVDKVVAADIGGGAVVNFNEVIGVQIINFINGFFAMKFSTSGVNILFDIGASEPLFLLA